MKGKRRGSGGGRRKKGVGRSKKGGGRREEDAFRRPFIRDCAGHTDGYSAAAVASSAALGFAGGYMVNQSLDSHRGHELQPSHGSSSYGGSDEDDGGFEADS